MKNDEDRKREVDEMFKKLDSKPTVKLNSRDIDKRRIAKYFMDNYSLNEAWKALYYLTDEDYANERHAIMFFAEKVIK